MSGGKCKTHSEDPSLHQAVKANRSTLSDPHFRNYLPSLEKIKEKGKISCVPSPYLSLAMILNTPSL